jgi:predicted DCC family thiol-disulfide oxidoreductase YuxK
VSVEVVRFTVKGQPDAAFGATGANAPAHGVGMGRPWVVVYDGHCKVCGRLVKMLRGWDRRGVLEIVPSQAPGVHARFPWIPARAYLESVQFIDARTGHTWQGAAAVEHIIDVMPKGRLITWVFSIPFVRPLAEKFYRWFARNRYKLGCGDHCQVRPELFDFGDEKPLTADR